MALKNLMEEMDPAPAAPIPADIRCERFAKPPMGIDGALPWVDLRFVLMQVRSVDTDAGTAFVQVIVAFYWTDSRLANWDCEEPLPGRLWGPRLDLTNALNDLEVEDQSFSLVDASTGRLKRSRLYSGTVDNPMDLQAFPFDLDEIEINFRTFSSWETLDRERSGRVDMGPGTYRLRQVCNPGDGQFIGLGFSKRIAQWSFHGVSSLITQQTNNMGAGSSDVMINLHVSRNARPYLINPMMPLYLLTALSMGVFHFETDNMEARYGTVLTCYLAAFVMLPAQADFLTKVDTMIVITTLVLAVEGGAALILAKIHKDKDKETAEFWNMVAELGLICMYVIANILIFVPAWVQQRRAVAQLDGYSRAVLPTQVERGTESEKNPMINEMHEKPQLPPTVRQGYHYIAYQDIYNIRPNNRRNPS
eukprot:COSAG02_NODE_86_length_39084_cov_17.815724_5_plen_420_part_00